MIYSIWPKGFGITSIRKISLILIFPLSLPPSLQQPYQPPLRNNIYSSPHGAVVVPLAANDESPEVLRISGDVQAVGYDHG